MAKRKRYEVEHKTIIRGPEGVTRLQEVREPSSVTEINKRVFDDSFGAGSWWGFKVAAGCFLGIDDLADPQVLELYERMKGEIDGRKITPNTIRDDAGGRGKLAHTVAESLAKGELTPDEVRQIHHDNPYAIAAALWFDEHGHEGTTIATEKQVYNPGLDVVGTLDYLRALEVGGEEIIDWKTTKPPVRVTQHIQIASYDLALGGGPRKQRVVLFQPDGKYVESVVSFDPRIAEYVKPLFDEIKRWEAEQ